jgi:hypothetical protein
MSQLALTIDGYDHGPLFQHGRVRRAARQRFSGGKEVWAKYLRARPAWANLRAISAAWAASREATKATGVQHSVDHIVPLRHPTVCGLHVENNLCVRPLLDNQRKGNRWWPDMWGEQQELEL